jgi:hypothetical protein
MLMRHYMDKVDFLEKGNVVFMSKQCSRCCNGQRNGFGPAPG